MGDVTRLLLTGATGFVGRAVLAQARAQGLEVVAVTRGAPPAAWTEAGVIPCCADLADPAAIPVLRAALRGVGAVIHCAAHLGSDEGAVTPATTLGTRHLLAAMAGQSARLVLVSSIAVYDYTKLAPGGTVTEATPLEQPDTARDAYVAGKLRQEAMCRDAGHPLWILRPGAIFGEGRTWNAHLGVSLGPLLVAMGQGGELPLAHVDHVARRLVRAAGIAPQGVEVLNLVDADRPDRARFLRAHRLSGWPRLVLPLPWPVVLPVARLLAPLGPRLPGLLREPVLRARILPLRYDARALVRRLGPLDQPRFEALMAAALKEGAA